MSSFTHLHVHSVFSLLDGILSLENLIQQAKQLNFKHLAITDHNVLYGAVNFFQLAQEAGIHAIIGTEVTLIDQSQLVLLVENNMGYRNLCNLLSLGHLRGGHLKFKLDLKDIIKHKNGLTILSGGQKGRLWDLTKRRKIEQAQTYCRRMKGVFGESFFIEIQHYLPNDFLVNIRLRDLAIQHGLPLVATNDVHLSSPKDWPLRQVLHAIDQNTLVEKISTAGNHDQYLKSAKAMNELFSKFPQAIQNTEKIAQRCTFEFSLGKLIFPRLDLPKDETAFSYLWKLAFEGAKQRYTPLTEPFINRLTYELNTINTLGFSDYFLIVKDIVDFCQREGIPCVGRGSAGDSVVSYVLGITQVDPIGYDLYFERFLNPDRSDPPDIDLDICWKNRDRVLEYVYKKYGKDRTAMICTFNTFQLRSSIRDVARTFGFSEDEISTITKYLPHYGIKQLNEAIENLPECRNLQQNSGVLKHVLEVAQTIADIPRHQSIHPGGVLIAPGHITDYTPLQVAGKGIVVAQYDMYSIEPLGLVKMDLLGVRSLSIITDCLKSVTALYQKVHKKPFQESDQPEESPVDNFEEINGTLPFASNSRTHKKKSDPKTAPNIFQLDFHKGKIVVRDINSYLTARRFPFLDAKKRHLSPLDLRVIPQNDPNVTALLRSGFSLGCFQTESPGMRGLLKKMQIDDVNDVITAVALIRPGASNSGMKDLYIQRRAGLLPVEYPHPLLASILKDTYGGIIYQEQVMQVAAEVAGFSLAQADILRKAMTKTRNKKILISTQNEFISGAQKKGLSVPQAEEIWKFMTNFVGYGFNKAHSATYGVIAYQTAYLKYYFSVFYMTAVLNNHGGFYSKAVYVEEARRMGIQILPPDVNFSSQEFTCFNDTIRVGLDGIYELTEKTKAKILKERCVAPFNDYYDFVQRTQPREGEIANLIKCGALRSIDPNEPKLLLQNKLFFKHKRNRNLTNALLQNVRLIPYNKYQRILKELEMLDFSVTDHPLALFHDQIDWKFVTPSFELETKKGQRIHFVGWLVTSRRVKTKNEGYMKFLTLEDRYGLCEAVMFPKVYQQYGHLVKSFGPYRVTGTIQSRLPGESNLLVEKLELIEISKPELEKKLQLKEKPFV